jgi:hypothetical protein
MWRPDDCRFADQRSRTVPALAARRTVYDPRTRLPDVVDTALIDPISDRVFSAKGKQKIAGGKLNAGRNNRPNSSATHVPICAPA